MTLIDTHTHLYSPEFDDDRKAMISRALEAGIEKFYLPAIDSSYTSAMLKTKSLFPDNIFLMAGLHPCSVNESFRNELARVKDFMEAHDFAGIGESGLDYYWDQTFINQQKESLHQHCEWALEYNKPLILHTRDSIDDAIDIVSEYKTRGLRGIFHCFSGTIDQANRIIELGFYLGIGGVLTFKNSGLDRVIDTVSTKHIVLETDSPYLAPTPYRGKRNESAYLTLVAEKLAAIKEVPVEEIARITTANADDIFGHAADRNLKWNAVST